MIPSLCGWVLLALSLGASTPSGAENVDVQGISFGEEILVTATAREEKDFDLPYSTFVLTGEDLRHRQMARTVPEALDEVPGVMVQATAHGQGSPYLRGFTGFRTLFLIDEARKEGRNGMAYGTPPGAPGFLIQGIDAPSRRTV